MAAPSWLTPELYLQLDFWLIRVPFAYGILVAAPVAWYAKNFAKDVDLSKVGDYRYKPHVPLWFRRFHGFMELTGALALFLMGVYAVVFHLPFSMAMNGGKMY